MCIIWRSGDGIALSVKWLDQGFEDSWFDSWHRREIVSFSKPSLEATQSPVQCAIWVPPWGTTGRCEFDRSLPSSAEFKNEIICTSALPQWPQCKDRDKFSLSSNSSVPRKKENFRSFLRAPRSKLEVKLFASSVEELGP
jgi:hypothetical protein